MSKRKVVLMPAKAEVILRSVRYISDNTIEVLLESSVPLTQDYKNVYVLDNNIRDEVQFVFNTPKALTGTIDISKYTSEVIELNVDLKDENLNSIFASFPIRLKRSTARYIKDPESEKILEYVPEIKFTPADINTINNIINNKIESVVKDTISNSITKNIKRIQDLKNMIQQVKSDLEQKLEDVTAKFDKNLLDDILIDRLRRLKDASRLINDGIITYQLYKQIKDDPSFAIIKDAWDEYHCGIDGSIEAEMLPYIDVVEQLVDGIEQFINDAILYDEEPQNISDIDKLRESEIALAEQHLRLQDDIKNAMDKGDEDKYTVTKKQFDIIDNTLKYRKNANTIISSALTKLTDIVKSIQDVTSDKFHSTQYNAIKQQYEAAVRNMNINNASMRAITYSIFTNEYNSVLETKRNYDNVMSYGVRDAIFKSASTNSRLYKDVAVPAMTELFYTDEELPFGTVGSTLVAGIEEIVKAYRYSMLSLKNMLESDANNVSNLVGQIYDKHRVRTTYNIIP